MKPQDIIFLFVLIILILKKDVRLATGAGIISLIVAMPLFAKWIFFTAERLTWYSWVFFLLATLLAIFKLKNENRN